MPDQYDIDDLKDVLSSMYLSVEAHEAMSETITIEPYKILILLDVCAAALGHAADSSFVWASLQGLYEIDL